MYNKVNLNPVRGKPTDTTYKKKHPYPSFNQNVIRHFTNSEDSVVYTSNQEKALLKEQASDAVAKSFSMSREGCILDSKDIISMANRRNSVYPKYLPMDMHSVNCKRVRVDGSDEEIRNYAEDVDNFISFVRAAHRLMLGPSQYNNEQIDFFAKKYLSDDEDAFVQRLPDEQTTRTNLLDFREAGDGDNDMSSSHLNCTMVDETQFEQEKQVAYESLPLGHAYRELYYSYVRRVKKNGVGPSTLPGFYEYIRTLHMFPQAHGLMITVNMKSKEEKARSLIQDKPKYKDLTMEEVEAFRNYLFTHFFNTHPHVFLENLCLCSNVIGVDSIQDRNEEDDYPNGDYHTDSKTVYDFSEGGSYYSLREQYPTQLHEVKLNYKDVVTDNSEYNKDHLNRIPKKNLGVDMNDSVYNKKKGSKRTAMSPFFEYNDIAPVAEVSKRGKLKNSMNVIMRGSDILRRAIPLKGNKLVNIKGQQEPTHSEANSGTFSLHTILSMNIDMNLVKRYFAVIDDYPIELTNRFIYMVVDTAAFRESIRSELYEYVSAVYPEESTRYKTDDKVKKLWEHLMEYHTLFTDPAKYDFNINTVFTQPSESRAEIYVNKLGSRYGAKSYEIGDLSSNTDFIFYSPDNPVLYREIAKSYEIAIGTHQYDRDRPKGNNYDNKKRKTQY